MKKLIVVIGIVMLASAFGFCLQPNSIGNVKADKVAFEPLTLAQVNALTPDTTHQVVVCSDCDFRLCISTGADSLARGGFVVVGSTVDAATSGAGIPFHCQ